MSHVYALQTLLEPNLVTYAHGMFITYGGAENTRTQNSRRLRVENTPCAYGLNSPRGTDAGWTTNSIENLNLFRPSQMCRLFLDILFHRQCKL